MGQKDHGFRKVSEKLEYENPFMAIYRREVVRPDKKTRPYWILNRRGDFAIIVPLFPDNSTILVGQYRIPIEAYSWEFPMGKTNSTVPLSMAKQELREETGYRAKKWKKLGDFYLAPGYSGQRSHVYLATELTEGVSEPEEDEYIETKKIPLSEVGLGIRNGKIKDGPTIVTYHLLESQGYC